MIALLLLACQPKETDPARGPASRPDTASVAAFQLAADTSVPLPYAVAGETVPEGEIEVREVGGVGAEGALTVEVTGEFAVEGALGPLAANERRGFSVQYTGDVGEPAIATGEAVLSADGQSVRVALAAVLGDPALPEATWTEDEWGWRAVVALPSAPFPYGSAPYDDPSVLLFAPHHLSDQGEIGVVTHLHGHNATLSEVVAAQHLVEQQALSGRDAVLIVPQGPEEAADGDFGRLDTEGGHAALVRDALSVLYRDGLITRPDAGEQVVTSHSGGYLCTSYILEQGGLEVSAVHLFDSLYARASVYEDFAASGGVFRSVYTSSGGTYDDNVALAERLWEQGVPISETLDDESLDNSDVTIAYTSASHSGCVTDSRLYARWLASSGLPRSPLAPPELLAVSSDGETAVVRWRLDRSPGAPVLRIEGSQDGEAWETLAEVEDEAGPGVGTARVEARPWNRIRSVHPDLGAGAPSDVYPGSGGEWLVVDGFDRVLGGSYTEPTHDFAARLGAALGLGVSAASDEAVSRGVVQLDDYNGVLWMLGDESTGDTTFDAAGRAAIASYVAGGGALIVSGAELGYATDGDWLDAVLRVSYVADDAGTDVAGGHRFGVVYEEDYPDVLAGERTVWSYETGGGAAVAWERVVVVGFPLETMTDETLEEAMPELLGAIGR